MISVRFLSSFDFFSLSRKHLGFAARSLLLLPLMALTTMTRGISIFLYGFTLGAECGSLSLQAKGNEGHHF